jgi:hypothetical protein
MEEHHARNLEKYYQSLAVHQHHNYYEGRANADLTAWVEYFTELLARVFMQAKDEALKLVKGGVPAVPGQLRNLDRRAKVVLSLFAKNDRIVAQDVVGVLGLSSRMVRVLLNNWVNDGWLVMAVKSNRNRAYTLSAQYRQFVGN